MGYYRNECCCGRADENYKAGGESTGCRSGLGGREAVSVYEVVDPHNTKHPTSAVPTTSSQTKQPTTAAPTTAKPTTMAPTVPVTPKNIGHLGCWLNNDDPMFNVRNLFWPESTENCLKLCTQQNFQYASVEDQNICYCGSANEDYKRYGSSTSCSNGRGGPNSSDVYELQNTCSWTIDNNHGHTFEGPYVCDMVADGTTKQFSIRGLAEHYHRVTLTSTQIEQTQKGGSVTITSSEAGHLHEFTISCSSQCIIA